MKIRYALFLAVLLGLLLFVAGCSDQPPPKTTTVNFAQPKAAESASAEGQELGSGIRVKFINPRKRGFPSSKEDSADIQRQMELFINSGHYEIVKVVTTRTNNSYENYLVAAEVYYREKKK